MNFSDNEQAVIGQKYAFATASLLVGIASFISLLGCEKALLAIIFGALALKTSPAPPLGVRRGWGKAGITLGALHLLLLAGLLLFAWPLLMAFLLYVSDIGHAVVSGPSIVMSAPSPDDQHVAYVEEHPSFDPPNQSLLVERKDRRRFMHVADLAEDVDSIRQIYWSPDSRIVVFHSRDYLTAVRLADWQTRRVFLGHEWYRHQPGRQSTFGSGGPGLTVESVEFPEADSFSYQVSGTEDRHVVRFGEVAPRPAKGG